MFQRFSWILLVEGITLCVIGRWAGVDSAWEQKKLEAREKLENGDESNLSSGRFVGPLGPRTHSCALFL